MHTHARTHVCSARSLAHAFLSYARNEGKRVNELDGEVEEVKVTTVSVTYVNINIYKRIRAAEKIRHVKMSAVLLTEKLLLRSILFYLEMILITNISLADIIPTALNFFSYTRYRNSPSRGIVANLGF